MGWTPSVWLRCGWMTTSDCFICIGGTCRWAVHCLIASIRAVEISSFLNKGLYIPATSEGHILSLWVKILLKWIFNLNVGMGCLEFICIIWVHSWYILVVLRSVMVTCLCFAIPVLRLLRNPILVPLFLSGMFVLYNLYKILWSVDFYVSWLVSQLTLCHHSAAWAYASASAWTTSSPKLQGLETCCLF